MDSVIDTIKQLKGRRWIDVRGTHRDIIGVIYVITKGQTMDQLYLWDGSVTPGDVSGVDDNGNLIYHRDSVLLLSGSAVRKHIDPANRNAIRIVGDSAPIETIGNHLPAFLVKYKDPHWEQSLRAWLSEHHQTVPHWQD